jgi:hypothetical protein
MSVTRKAPKSELFAGAHCLGVVADGQLLAQVGL